MEVEDDSKSLAAAAKARGNKLFTQKTKEGYTKALEAYQQAIAHDPLNHIFYANCSACNVALAKDAWDNLEKVQFAVQALLDAKKCTEVEPSWAKGFLRQADAEFELVEASKKWEDRKIQDAKWAKDDAGRVGGMNPEDEKEEIAKNVLSAEFASVATAATLESVEASCRAGLELDSTNLPLRVRLQAVRDAGHATDEVMDRTFKNSPAAAPCKAEGNKAFSAAKFQAAVDHYTQALAQDPVDHVFYSNRSACYASLDEPEKALRDAERCVALAPQFVKGYSRQGSALYNLGRYPDAERAVQTGLAIDASNAALKALLVQVQVETCETPSAQAMMFKLRQDKKKDLKMKQLMSSLNLGGMGGNGMKMFSPDMMGGMGSGGLEAMLSGGSKGFGNNNKPVMTEEQMRQVSRQAK